MAREGVTQTAKYLVGNNATVSVYHRADLLEIYGQMSGRVLASSYVARCTGRSLGGPWGSTVMDAPPDDYRACRRCCGPT